MAILRKCLEDLSEAENLMYRALCTELESIAENIQEEASCTNPDFTAIATAQRDRRLAVEWLRKLNLPPAAIYCTGPSEKEEEQLLSEAVQ
jgi:hypothetical protein